MTIKVCPECRGEYPSEDETCPHCGYPVLQRCPCYLSTPEHLQSFVGRFLYIYTDNGELTLTETVLRFVSRNGTTLEIPLSEIVDIELGHFPRLAKPFRLDYISVHQRRSHWERAILFTPTRSWLAPVWQTNKIVAQWLEALRSAWSRNAELRPRVEPELTRDTRITTDGPRPARPERPDTSIKE